MKQDNVLSFYDLVINKEVRTRGSVHCRGTSSITTVADGPEALGKFFGKITGERALARVVVHKIMAVGDYVFAHVNFLNLFNDDPKDTGIAGVDIYKMDADGRAIEHWDTLQPVGDPKNSAPWLAPNMPRANSNGMF